MSNNIMIKEVNFMGDTLMAAQDENQQVWVGVSWVCEGIGLSEGQIKAERLKLKSDLVLKPSGRNFVLNEFGYGNRDVFCIIIDFLPLWLAKISITPKMKELTPHVVEKLVSYQLKAKDVLAAAFLPQYVQPKAEQQLNITSMLNQFYWCLESSMRSELKVRFNETIPVITQMLSSANTPMSMPAPAVEVREIIKEVPYSAPLPLLMSCPDGQDWKQWVYYMLDTYIMLAQTKQTRKEVLSEVYAYLCKHYGMVSDQLAKEYRHNHSCMGRTSTITLIETNKKWRNIFDCVLCDKVNNITMSTQNIATCLTEVLPVQSEEIPSVECDDLVVMIGKLIALRDDTTIHGGATYRAIYKKMYTPKEWRYKIGAYKRKMGVATSPKRISVIMSNAKLKKECIDVVTQMLNETV